MIGRRDMLRGVAFGAALVTAQSVSACSSFEFDNDEWGTKLVEFLRTGDNGRLDNLFRSFSTLVTFDPGFVDAEELPFAGQKNVQDALIGFRKRMTEAEGVGSRALIDAKIVGNGQQGRMNRIELLFADGATGETSCGPTRNEQRVDLYYEAQVSETGEDSVKWAIQRIAILPPLEMEKLNG